MIATFEDTGVFIKKDRLLFELDLKNDYVPSRTASKDLRLVMIVKEDVEQADEFFDGWFKKEKVLERLEKGHVLFAVKVDGQMVFYQWIEFSVMVLPSIDLFYSLPEDTAYIAYTYTEPEYRGRGIATSAKALLLDYLYTEGYRKILLMIAPQNIASQKVNQKVGFTAYQAVNYRKILFMKYYVVKDSETGQRKVFWAMKNSPRELWRTFSKIEHRSSPYETSPNSVALMCQTGQLQIAIMKAQAGVKLPNSLRLHR